MIDFKINNKGDLILSKQEEFPRMKIQWMNASFPVFRVQFFQGEEFPQMKHKDGFKLTFHTSNALINGKSKTNVVKGIEELKQRILVFLRTEYGEMLTKQDFGSQVSIMKHKTITDPSVLSTIEEIIKSELSDAVHDLNVEVAAASYEGPFYCQNVNVYIWQGKELLYEFNV